MVTPGSPILIIPFRLVVLLMMMMSQRSEPDLGQPDGDEGLENSVGDDGDGGDSALRPGREPRRGGQDDDQSEPQFYLPARHPLHATPDKNVSAPPSSPRNRLREVAVMDLPSGVVVFPGDSLPLRVKGPWERHLSGEIDRQRLHPTLDAVQFGVITEASEARSRAGGEYDDNDDPHRRRRPSFGSMSRLSWTRQAWGPRRLSRYSYRLAQELQQLADAASSSDEEDDDEDNNSSSSNGRAESDVDGGEGADRETSAADGNGGNVGDGAQSGAEIAAIPSDGEPDSLEPRRRRHFLVSIDSQGRMALSVRGMASAPIDPSNADAWGDGPRRDPPPRRDDPSRRSAGDPAIGRIGTLVTVLYTHGDDLSRPEHQPLGSSHVWRQHGQELIITARGTGRFRVVRAVLTESVPASVKRYLVEELTEDEMSRPTLALPPLSGGISTIGILARATPIPEFVWRRCWPDHLASQIGRRLHQSSSHRALVRSMRDERRGPLRLSYWLSSNMALQQHEKVALLEMMSPVERLRWILRRLQEVEKSETVLQCKRCACPITRGSHAFTVRGSQGTTGNCKCQDSDGLYMKIAEIEYLLTISTLLTWQM
jgi:hypothetical protein